MTAHQARQQWINNNRLFVEEEEVLNPDQSVRRVLTRDECQYYIESRFGFKDEREEEKDEDLFSDSTFAENDMQQSSVISVNSKSVMSQP